MREASSASFHELQGGTHQSDELKKDLSRPLNLGDDLAMLGLKGWIFDQQLRESEDTSNGCPNLVRHVADKDGLDSRSRLRRMLGSLKLGLLELGLSKSLLACPAGGDVRTDKDDARGLLLDTRERAERVLEDQIFRRSALDVQRVLPINGQLREPIPCKQRACSPILRSTLFYSPRRAVGRHRRFGWEARPSPRLGARAQSPPLQELVVEENAMYRRRR